MSNNNFQWSKEKPTEPGNYAWRNNGKINNKLLDVFYAGGELVCFINGDPFKPAKITELADREWLKLPE